MIDPGCPDPATTADATPKRFDPDWLCRHLRALIGPLRGARLCVAYSGGLDSRVLLSALALRRARERFTLRALHVNHQLQPDAARWARDAGAVARALKVPCRVLSVRVDVPRGASLEAQAREQRYLALEAHVGKDEWLLTAHHQDDQFETLMLALLRGSGVRGLAAMAAVSRRGALRLVRPLLPVSRVQLEHFARSRRLTWVEDPSNADPRFDRNFLRLRVLPLLRERWPAAGSTAARSAAHLAEAAGLLDELARTQLADAHDGDALRVSALRALPLAERRNAVRYWLASCGLSAPDQRRLREICGPLLAARADASPRVAWSGGELRRHGDRLVALQPAVPATRPAALLWDWKAQPWLALPQGGALGLAPDAHGEVRLDRLPRPLQVCFRTGGERLGEPGAPTLKELLQQQGIAPWQRETVPLLMDGHRLIAVADLWLDPGCRADASRVARARLRWRPV